MDTNKIIRSGFMLFSIVLFIFAALKYNSQSERVAIYYFIGAIGFFIIYLSYRKKGKRS